MKKTLNKYLKEDGSLMSMEELRQRQISNRKKEGIAHDTSLFLDRSKLQFNTSINHNVTLPNHPNTSLIHSTSILQYNPNESMLIKEKLFQKVVRTEIKKRKLNAGGGRSILLDESKMDQSTRNFHHILGCFEEEKGLGITLQELMDSEKLRKFEGVSPFVRVIKGEKEEKVGREKEEIEFRKQSGFKDFSRILNKLKVMCINQEMEIEKMENGGFTKEVRNKINSLDVGERDSIEEESEEETTSEELFEESSLSDESFFKFDNKKKNKKKTEDKIKESKEDTKKNEMEVKRQKFLSLYNKTKEKNHKEFKISSTFPIDYILREEIILKLDSNIQLFNTVDEKLITLATYYKTTLFNNHGININNNNYNYINYNELNKEALLLACFTSYQYPKEDITSELEKELNGILLKKEKEKSINKIENELMKQFNNTKEEWKQSFNELVMKLRVHLLDYFYYITDEMSILFLNIDNNCNAIIFNSNQQFLNDLKLRDIPFEKYNTSMSLKSERNVFM
ncbi:hypothetical protein K502DRAFT_325141, partial [Neoconidiobolus thromboides FSU 785]